MRYGDITNKSFTSEGVIAAPPVNRIDIAQGAFYIITGRDAISLGEFKGTPQTYFHEYVNNSFDAFYKGIAGVRIVTDEKGNMPFAAYTSDSQKDKLGNNTLSKVLLKKDYYIIDLFHRREYPLMIINILKVVDVTSPHSTLPCIRVKVVDKFVIPPDLLGPESIPDLERSNILFLHNAVNHARFMSSVFDVETYKLPKYSFNPGRVMLHKIFFKNTDGKFESVITSDDLSKNKSTKLDKPRKIIINDNSEIIKQAGDKEVIFVRCFFSKKWLLSHTIFADGYILDPLTYEEVPDYLDKSNIDLSRIASIVHEVEFNGKYKILATADSNLSTIRPIYKSATGGYSSFKLNNFDMFLINKISVVNP